MAPDFFGGGDFLSFLGPEFFWNGQKKPGQGLFWSRESLSQRAYLKDAMAECLLAGLLAAAASRELPLLLVPEKGDPGGCCLDGGW